jgi:hypothetical protein
MNYLRNISGSDWLSLLGLAATVAFGIWGLIVVLRQHYPGEITFVHKPHLALFRSIIVNFPEIKAQFNGNPVGPGLVLIRGTLVNTGTKDISASMVEEKLTFRLPPEHKWLSGKVVRTTALVEANVTAEQQSLIFSTGLFRCSEFIQFQAIAEVPVGAESGSGDSIEVVSKLKQAIKIEHRIADTKPVLTIESAGGKAVKRKASRFLALSIANSVVFLWFCAIWSSGFRSVPTEVHFFVSPANQSPVEVYVDTAVDGSIVAKGMKTNYTEKLPVNAFMEKYYTTAKVLPAHGLKGLVLMLIAMLFL